MSTLPPNIRQAPSKALVRSVKMATVKAVKVKSAASKTNVNGTPKAKTQMHRRSRSGCYTCRLRRKKCDEGAPFCTACQHLGLECQYKRPLWWSNNDARRRNKEDIKIIIKRKKLAEKASAHALHASVTPPPPPPPPPPSLSHSLSTSISGPDSVSGFYDRNRSASIDSHASASASAPASASANFNFNSPPTGPVPDFVAYNPSIHAEFAYSCSPYEMDVKTERQMFVNNVPTMRESHISTFSTAHTPPPPGTVLPAGSYPNGTWVWPVGAEEEEVDGDLLVDEDQIMCRRESSQSEEALNVSFFDFSHGPPQESRQVRIELDDNDQRLLEHFIQFVLPTIFPILESNQHGSVSSDLILPALQSNSIYLHCCLSIAAQHMKAIGATDGGDIDGDIMRHRYATIWSLCEALKCDENHEQILEATLGLIFYQCIVGRPDDGLLDIAWHQHFQAAISLVQKLDLPRIVSEEAGPTAQTPFNMTLTAWIDILGASMLGQSPAFAHTYREKHLSQNHQLGLRELMGCEDRVMYLISEIACLESLKRAGMDDFILCQHVSSLGEQISMTEVGDWTPRLPFNANGSLSPKQLCRNITSAFRIAARIYLCSLVPGFSPSQPSPMTLVDKLTAVLQCIPAGTHSDVGYDRSLVWVYLIGGSISGPDSPFRTLVEERVAGMGEQAKCGSFGRMVSVLRETWSQNDLLAQATTPGSTCSDGIPRHVHWRDVMQMNGWDYLLL